MPAQKIVTCCYCGTRAALVLRGTERHELSCTNCGAPLHDLKVMPAASEKKREKVKHSTPKNAPPRDPRHHDRPKRRKRRKSLKRKIFEEAWDVLEDIFD